ncbi:MAG: ATP-dependent RNA helicase RhlB [Gammaproteobacteria bacterium]|jgi:ATP-dependent RNA helicase RhlB
MSEQHLTEIRFRSLPLNPLLLDALDDLGFEFCTPIQAAALPKLLNENDISGQAQTGTGKTLAFLLSACHQLLKSEKTAVAGKPRVLILAPTRELALQIHKDAVSLLAKVPLTLALCYGGKGYEQQIRQFDKPVDILIGTPGRLIDFLKQKLYSLKSAEVMILDEADRMFDMGFISDVRFLLRRLPPPENRLNMLFSATMAHKVMELAYEHMNNAELVKIETDSPIVERIEQSVYHPANHEKIPLLLGLFKSMKPGRSIIFANTKHVTIRIWEFLQGNGIPAAIISGDIQQSKREKLLGQFHNGEFAVLVATDVASRGLHIPDVTHVFNYDLPDQGEDYVHRIGRTARAGNSGYSISFACEDYAMNLMDIEEYIKRTIPTCAITSGILADPLPRVRMEKQSPAKHGGGKPKSNNNQSRSKNRRPNSNSNRSTSR